MDIDRVRYFHVFAETGSLVKAAEVLHISQPALSKALKTLEHEIGAKLLAAEGRGLRLTEEGKRFRAESAQLLQSWMELPAKLKSKSAAEPTRIGSFEVFTTYFLGHLVKSADLSQLEVHEYGPGRLETALAEGRVDIGITYLPVPKNGVEFTEAGKIRMGVYGLVGLASAEFATLPFAIPLQPAEGTPSKVMGLDGWPDHRYARKISYRVTMMESAMELCRRGLAVAYLPSFVVDLHNQDLLAERRLVEIKSPVPAKDRLQSVYLVHKKGAEESRLARQIAKAIRSLN